MKYWKCDECHAVMIVEPTVSLEGIGGRGKHFCDAGCFWHWIFNQHGKRTLGEQENKEGGDTA